MTVYLKTTFSDLGTAKNRLPEAPVYYVICADCACKIFIPRFSEEPIEVQKAALERQQNSQ